MTSRASSWVPACHRAGLTTAKISPSLHNLSSPIEAVGASISSLHRSPDLMAQRFFEEVARKTGILSPRPKCGS